MRHIHAIISLDEPAAHGHPVADGNIHRSDVVIANDGENFLGIEPFKGICFASTRRFERISVLPVLARKEISDLQHPLSGDILPGQSALADHFARRFQHHRPEPEPIRAVALKHAIEPSLRFLIGKRVLVGKHRLPVLQDSGQRGIILLRHFAQQQSRRFEDHRVFPPVIVCARGAVCVI